jgi:hypothetical protein
VAEIFDVLGATRRLVKRLRLRLQRWRAASDAVSSEAPQTTPVGGGERSSDGSDSPLESVLNARQLWMERVAHVPKGAWIGRTGSDPKPEPATPPSMSRGAARQAGTHALAQRHGMPAHTASGVSVTGRDSRAQALALKSESAPASGVATRPEPCQKRLYNAPTFRGRSARMPATSGIRTSWLSQAPPHDAGNQRQVLRGGTEPGGSAGALPRLTALRMPDDNRTAARPDPVICEPALLVKPVAGPNNASRHQAVQGPPTLEQHRSAPNHGQGAKEHGGDLKPRLLTTASSEVWPSASRPRTHETRSSPQVDPADRLTDMAFPASKHDRVSPAAGFPTRASMVPAFGQIPLTGVPANRSHWPDLPPWPPADFETCLNNRHSLVRLQRLEREQKG